MTIAQTVHAIAGHLQADDLVAARALAQALLREAPEYPPALHMMGLVEVASGAFSAGAEHFRQAIAKGEVTSESILNCFVATRSTGVLQEESMALMAQAMCSDAATRAEAIEALFANEGFLSGQDDPGDLVTRWMARWPCSTMLLMYFTWRTTIGTPQPTLIASIAALLAPLLSIATFSGLPFVRMALSKKRLAEAMSRFAVSRKSTDLPTLSTAR